MSELHAHQPFLKAASSAGWGCIAVGAIFVVRMTNSEPALALAAGLLVVASLLLSRYIVGLKFTTGAMLYLVLLSIFHLGLVVPSALGLYDMGRMAWFNPYGLSRALALIVYSIVAYQIGLLLASIANGPIPGSVKTDGAALDSSEIFFIGCFMFAVAVVMFVGGLMRLDPSGYYRLTYSETFRLRAETDPRVFGSGITVGFMAVCLLVAGASKRQMRITFWCAGAWVLMLFYFGFRGPALIAGLVVWAGALKKGIAFPRIAGWCIVAVLLVAVPTERVIRDEPLNDRSIGASLRDINLLDAPAEMGTSIRPLAETADLVDSSDFRHGRTYLTGLKGVLPNLAVRWEAPDTESIDELPPSHWITAVVDPWAYRNYGGMGFSAIAEPYMNFGIAGVIVYFVLIAILLVQLERVAIRNSYALGAWALVLGPLLWTTRNDFANFFRPAVWGLLCLALVRLWAGSYSLMTRFRRADIVSRQSTAK